MTEAKTPGKDKLKDTANTSASEAEKIREHEGNHQEEEMAEILSDAAQEDPSV